MLDLTIVELETLKEMLEPIINRIADIKTLISKN